jgi:hypothetical protein
VTKDYELPPGLILSPLEVGPVKKKRKKKYEDSQSVTKCLNDGLLNSLSRSAPPKENLGSRKSNLIGKEKFVCHRGQTKKRKDSFFNYEANFKNFCGDLG